LLEFATLKRMFTGPFEELQLNRVKLGLGVVGLVFGLRLGLV